MNSLVKPYAPRYVAVLMMMFVTLAASIWFTRKAPADVAVADVTQIPQVAGNWQSIGDVPIDPITMKQISADSYIQRRYVNPEGKTVDILIVYRRYGRRDFAHRPELCFPAAGFQITKKDRTTLPYGGRSVQAIHLQADGSKVMRADGITGVPTTTISYFFASGNRTECDFMKQQVWMTFSKSGAKTFIKSC